MWDRVVPCNDNFSNLKILGIPVCLYWSPGHKGLKANELAGTLEKEATHQMLEYSGNGLLRAPLLASLSKSEQPCQKMISREDEEDQLYSGEMPCFRFRKDPEVIFQA